MTWLVECQKQGRAKRLALSVTAAGRLRRLWLAHIIQNTFSSVQS